MLESISWKHYIIAIACFAFIWYLAVILLFYRKELREFLKGNLRPGKSAGNRTSSPTELEDDYGDSFEELENMVSKIRHSILLKAGKEASKEELIDQLSDMLANYSGLRRPAYRIALNNFIIQNAESICGILFTETELESAWDRLQQ